MRRTGRGIFAALLALALLAAQAVGLAHRVVHGLPLGDGGGPAAHAVADPGLFAAHQQGGIECRLLDHAAHADALIAAAWPALPPLVSAVLPAPSGTTLGAGSAHAYLARGPPAGLRSALLAA